MRATHSRSNATNREWKVVDLNPEWIEPAFDTILYAWDQSRVVITQRYPVIFIEILIDLFILM